MFPLGAGQIPSIHGGAGGAAGPSASDLLGGDSAFNSSGWTVATSASRAAGGLDLTTVAVIGAIAIVGLMLWKKL